MTTDETPPRATTASIDRRVERLEVALESQRASMSALERKVDSSIEHQGYTDELLRMKFTGLEAGQSTASAKFDAFVARFDNTMAEAMRSAGDLEATAVGKLVNTRLARVEDRTETHQSDIDQMRGALAFARGLALVATTLASVAAVLSVLHVSIPL